MEIGSKKVDAPAYTKYRGKKVNELLPQELREAANLGLAPEEWLNQQISDEGLNLPTVSYKNGNYDRCENETTPDKDIPSDLFNFELILNSRKFNVCIDTLIRIKHEEDLTQFSDIQLQKALEMCAAYRVTCFCAYIAAKREHRKWKMFNEIWMAEKREVARGQLRADRVGDRAAGLRKEIGIISAQELEDYIISKHGGEYKVNREREEEWKENSEVYLELRDTLKDRGMHLQTLLKRINDHTDSAITSRGD